jgi:116 kDa U5 small nuclear ribonucleoprotein component
MQFPNQIYNICLCGNIGHGKTSFMDYLIQQTHSFSDENEDLRYTDIHEMERDRGISIKAQPMSFLLPDSKGKSFLFNVIDTPGHVDFIDEVCAGLKLCDSAALIIDCVDGVLLNTQRIIKLLISSNIPFIVILNKIDRFYALVSLIFKASHGISSTAR